MPPRESFSSRDLLRFPQDQSADRRHSRVGSFLTDKDPSFIQPNDATYSDIGDVQVAQQPQGEIEGVQQAQIAQATNKETQLAAQISRSKTVSFAIVKEFSFGGTAQQHAALLDKSKFNICGGQQSMGLDLSQNSLQDDKSKKSPPASQVDLTSQLEGTSNQKDYILSINKLFSSNALPQDATNSLPLHTLRCHVLHLLKNAKANETI